MKTSPLFVIINFNRKLPKLVDNNAPFVKTRKIKVFTDRSVARSYININKLKLHRIVHVPLKFVLNKVIIVSDALKA